MKLKAIVRWELISKKVEVTKLIIRKDRYMKYPMIIQARIKWKDEAEEIHTDWVDGDLLEFTND
jgi:multisubunit Na+/H+ antiporter MnhE subunit